MSMGCVKTKLILRLRKKVLGGEESSRIVNQTEKKERLKKG